MKILSSLPEITFDDVLLLPGYSRVLEDKDSDYCDISGYASKNLKLKLPIISSPMAGVTEKEMAIEMAKYGGLGILHFFMSRSQQIEQAKEVIAKGFPVGVAVGEISDASLKHCVALSKMGVSLISLESLHAFNGPVITFLKKLRKQCPKLEISVAHVVTPEATEALIKAGASSIRVGIGGGSHCLTRMVTGVGRPQLSAVQACSKVAKKYGIPIISDTGIKHFGDIAKALAFGASSVMVGGLLTGTDCSPGPIIKKDDKNYKFSQGNCSSYRDYSLYKISLLSQIKRKIKNSIKKLLKMPQQIVRENVFLDEGVSSLIPYKGETAVTLQQLTKSIQRSLWYVGATSITDLQKNAKIIITSHSTLTESKARV